MTRDSARNRDAKCAQGISDHGVHYATAQCNGAIQHSKVGGRCQDRYDDDDPGSSNVSLTTPSSAIPELEGR